MASQALLTELCGICNNAPKYRCPGCDARTCSLPCYKRHQEWAQCSGKRDPTKYLKRSELATPAGLDHDYNFISKIERALDRADEDAEERGIELDKASVKKKTRGPVAESNHYRRLQETKVIIDYAPMGMSRQRTNKTHYQRQKHYLIWTVEWVHDDKTAELDQVADVRPLSEAYTELLARKTKKRKHEQAHESKDRSAPGKTSTGVVPQSQSAGKTDTQPVVAEADSKPATAPTPATSDPQTLQSDTAKYFFYLRRPHTTSSKRILIPLSSSDTLLNCLSNQVVLEYPTIQVLPHDPTSLPPEFQLESDYIKHSGVEGKELKGLLAIAKPPTDDEQGDEVIASTTEERIDDKLLLDVLNKDIGSRA